MTEIIDTYDLTIVNLSKEGVEDLKLALALFVDTWEGAIDIDAESVDFCKTLRQQIVKSVRDCEREYDEPCRFDSTSLTKNQGV